MSFIVKVKLYSSLDLISSSLPIEETETQTAWEDQGWRVSELGLEHKSLNL